MFQLGDRVIVENSERMQYSFDQRCQCVVGQISIHPLKACHIGTPNRLRWLGIRPRSGNEVYILEHILASAELWTNKVC